MVGPTAIAKITDFQPKILIKFLASLPSPILLYLVPDLAGVHQVKLEIRYAQGHCLF